MMNPAWLRCPVSLCLCVIVCALLGEKEKKVGTGVCEEGGRRGLRGISSLFVGSSSLPSSAAAMMYAKLRYYLQEVLLARIFIWFFHGRWKREADRGTRGLIMCSREGEEIELSRSGDNQGKFESTGGCGHGYV